MKIKSGLIYFIIFWALSAFAVDEFLILDKNGNELTAEQRQNFKLEIKTIAESDKVNTVEYSLQSLTDQDQFYQLRYTRKLYGKKIQVFDGIDLVPENSQNHSKRMLIMRAFPLTAAWTENSAVALASGAEDHHSFVWMNMLREDDNVQVSITVNAALLKKASVYKGKFHLINFSSKYDEREAFSRYYKLYPQRFLPNPNVDPRLYGLSATYACWMRSDPEWNRFASAEWDWCLHAGRHWGDVSGDYYDLSHEKYIEPYYFAHRSGKWDPKNLKDLPWEKFREVQKQRLANGYFCGIANAFYTTGASRIHNDMAGKFPDSLAADNPCVIDHYSAATSIFAFPETSWYKELMRMFEVVTQRDDVSAIAFDIPLESEVYRGSAMFEMSNVGFDEHGAGVARAVANSKLYQAINQLESKYGKYQVGVVKNGNAIHQINDCFYADCNMVESNPWQYAPPWPRAVRYLMGEKAVTFWEGYHPEEFDSNYREWPKETSNQLIRDLSRYVAHRSFLYGVGYGAHFINEYLSRLSVAMRACLQARYKIVPGMITNDKTITLTRYGNADNSFIALCNTGKENIKTNIEVFSAEFYSDLIENKSEDFLLFAGFYGSEVEHIFKNKQEFLLCDVPALRVNILEAVASTAASNTGRIKASWEGDFSEMKLKLVSEDFNGRIKLRKNFGSYELKGREKRTLRKGRTLVVKYVNKLIKSQDEAMKNLPLNLTDTNFVIKYATDPWSKDMAERISVFFRKMGECEIEWIEDSKLPKFTAGISIDGNLPKFNYDGILLDAKSLFVKAKNREELSVYVRQMLDALNAIKYPEYIYGVSMDEVDRKVFPMRRYHCSY